MWSTHGLPTPNVHLAVSWIFQNHLCWQQCWTTPDFGSQRNGSFMWKIEPRERGKREMWLWWWRVCVCVCVWGGGGGLVTGSKPILRRYVALQVMELISSYWNYETQKQGIAVSQSWLQFWTWYPISALPVAVINKVHLSFGFLLPTIFYIPVNRVYLIF